MQIPGAEVIGRLVRNGGFVRLLSGRIVSNAGDSLYYVAAMWMIYDLTGSAAFTGLAGFLIRAPGFLSMFVGPLVDRWPLRGVLVVSQGVNALVVLVVPVAYFLDVLTVWLLLAVLPVVTFVNQFMYPAQNAALPQLVTERDLTAANSLLAAGYRGADTVFNAASGVLIALIGTISAFVLDAVTFLVAMALFAGIVVPSDESDPAEVDEPDEGSYLADLREGIRLVHGSTLVPLLGGVFLTNLTAGALLGVLPAYAATISGPDAFGILMASYAAGTFLGILLASYLDRYAFGRVVSIAFPLGGLALVVAIFSPWFPMTVIMFFLSFVPVGSFNVQFWTLLQSTVDVDLLGRVSALAKSVGTVAIPVGSLVGGFVADVISVELVVLSWGLGLLFFGLYVGLRPSLRRIPSVTAAEPGRLGLQTG